MTIDWTTLALWLLAFQLWEMRAALARHRRQLRDGLLYLGRDLSGLRRQELRRLMGLPALLLGLLVLPGCAMQTQAEGTTTTREHSRPDGSGGTVTERETVWRRGKETTLTLPPAAAAGIDMATLLAGGGGTLGAGALALTLLKRRQQHTSALERT